MPKITLSKPWSYFSTPATIDYPAGDHDVSNEVYAAALGAGLIEEKKNGRGAAKDGSTGAADPAQE